MTTLPTNPPAAINPANRSGGAATAAQAVTIDPVKLLNRHKWLLVAAAGLGALLGVGAHYFCEQFFPRWKPIAVFQVTPPAEDITTTVGIVNAEEMNRFMQTQIRILTSDPVLTRVVDDPSLQQNAANWTSRYMRTDPQTGERRFNSARALRVLKNDLGARVYPNTSLIELSYSHRYREDATAIIGLVREKYLAVLANQGQIEQDDRTKSLRDTITRIDNEVAGLQLRRRRIIESDKLESIDERVNATQVQLQGINAQSLTVRQDLTAARKQLSMMRDELGNPQGFSFADEYREAAERDPIVLDLKGTLGRLESEQQGLLNRGMGRDHREFRAVAARIEGVKQNLAETLNNTLRRIFDSQLDRLAKAVASLEAQEAELVQKREETTTRLVSLAQLQTEILDIDRQIDNLLRTKGENQAALQKIISMSQLTRSNRVIEYQRERVPSELSFPQLKFMIPLGIIVGIGLVGGIIVIREIADQRVKGPADITLMPRMKLLGWVPDAAEDPEGTGSPETAFRDRPRGVVAESYRQLRSALSKRVEHAGHRVILVMAGMPGAGASSVTANLALALAAADKKVLVIDANLRRPSLHRVFGAQEAPGLADILSGKKTLEQSVQHTSIPNVDLLSAGAKEFRVVERLSAAAKGDVLAFAKANYDIVLVDVAPAVVAGDGLALAQRADASILVVRAMSDKRGMVARLRNELADARSEFLGVVVNGVRSSAGGYLRGNIRTASEYTKA
ncbi:MAG: polysaccharide biosynthesis tyrosine autokinase [Phycisphaeraceae bacterium]|nr:polysaccharide biosynthesis tyrosine autokinase [Phycisphaeraceae bacterium]